MDIDLLTSPEIGRKEGGTHSHGLIGIDVLSQLFSVTNPGDEWRG